MRKLPFLLFALFAAANISAQQIDLDKTEINLLEKMEAAPETFLPVYIQLTDQVDINTLDEQLTLRKASRSERAETVIMALQAKAQATQGALLEYLRSNEYVKTETVQGYWAVNAIYAQVQAAGLIELSHRDDVVWIEWDAPVKLEHYESLGAAPVSPDGTEPGLRAINAPALWEMGYTGYGQAGLVMDTGTDPSHPALIGQNRNFYVPKDQTWYTNSNDFEPYDCDDHGTHVAGTMFGLDRLNNDTIGVAFNAQWMGASVIGCGSEGSTVGAIQWAFNPDGDPSTSDDMPRVINNSWGRDANISECTGIWLTLFETTEAAGISVVFSAGNSGPGMSTLTGPKNVIINEVNPFTVANVNGNSSSHAIASSSSRGPSICPGDSALLIKPEVAAPGVSVRSSVPGGGYSNFSGTSMASPHVAGAILLLGEAFPELSASELKWALYLTCTDLGEPGEDNTYGQGIINVLAAFDYLVGQGHVPVSPYRANDIMLVDVRLSSFSCEGQVAPAIVAENAGTDTIYSFEITYEVASNTALETWTGVLPPRERVSLALPPLTAPGGNHDVMVRVGQPNGVEDERPLNNNFRRTANVTDREPFNAYALGGPVACEGTSALLWGDSPYPGGEMEIQWFDEPGGTEPVYTGGALLTPPLTASTTYFAEAKYVLGVGPEDASFGEQTLRDPDDFRFGMRFEVKAALTLKSVTVEAEETGGRALILEDASGESIKTHVAVLSETGQVEVPLDWELEPGNYTLFCTIGKPLVCNNSGAEYPYVIDDFFSLRGTSTGGVNDDNWYYFYDWKVEFTEPCGRTQVDIEVGPAGNAPVASFTPSVDTFSLDNNAPVVFGNTSEMAETFLWNFDDGTTSEEASPEHVFTAAGIYTVSLIVTSADGCTDATLHTIVVEAPTLSSTDEAEAPSLPNSDWVEVFPNPITDLLTVHLELSTIRPVTLHLSDLSGRKVRSAKFAAVQNGKLEMPVADLPDGVYFLMVEMETGAEVWKVVKI